MRRAAAGARCVARPPKAWRHVSMAGLVAGAMLQSSFASAPLGLPPPPSDAARNAIRTVAVVSTGQRLQPPAASPSGLSQAAGGGAKAGMSLTAGAMAGHPAGVVLAPILIPGGALIGMML